MLYLIIGAVFLLIDQITKFITVAKFNEFESFTFINGVLDFTRYHNTGGPWSMLDEYSRLFILFTFAIFVVEYFYFKKHPLTHSLSKLCCALINAGAVGNLIDRIFRGYVVDMIKVTFIDYPVFNFADCCIVVGCILMCFYVIFIQKDKSEIKTIDNEESHDGKDNN